ncbi:MAG: hypothetical protein HQK78_18065 [Desulfobacterales bacterium]|nr:hypothetical protein [Desulfobacterales bacterium]
MTIKGNLEIQDKILGDFIVPNTEFSQCENCGEKLYSPITLKAIEETEAKKKEELLLKKPLNSFIPASQVAKILKCTRQAIHKHKKIKRGFIHFINYNGTLQYLKESVELFKKTGDGRIPLIIETKKKNNIIDINDFKNQKKQSPKYQLNAGYDYPCFNLKENKSTHKSISNEVLMEG